MTNTKLPNRVIIGKKLRMARHNQNLTLRKLGEEASISAGMLSQIETNKAYPSVGALFKIAEVLNLPIDYFFEPQHTVTSSNSISRGAIIPNPNGHHHVEWDVSEVDGSTPFIVRSNSRPRIELKSGISLSTLTTTAEPGIQFLEIAYAPETGPNKGKAQHEGKEFGLVLEGALTVELGNETHTLLQGDSIMIDTTVPHRLSNPSNKPVRALWVGLSDHFCLFEHFGQ